MKHRRRGTSLVEMLVVIGLAGVMISTTGVCLHGLYQAEQEVREAAVRRAAIAHLSSQFRADAHAAGRVHLRAADAGAKPGLQFSNSDGSTIEYYQQDDRVVRTVKQADEVLHTDAFRLGHKYAVTWEVDGGQPPTVSADLARQSRVGRQWDGGYRERIEAVVGVHASLLTGDS